MQLPPGASALDAWAELREAESRVYRLRDDGVRSFSCRVRSPLFERLTARSSPLEGAQLDVRLEWHDGLARATVGCDRPLDPLVRDRITSLVEPLAELLFPAPLWSQLRGSSFRFRDGDAATMLRPGERGIEALTRSADSDRRRSLITIGPDGLVASERRAFATGEASEFRHAYRLDAGRWLATGLEGKWRGRDVAIAIDWAGGGVRPTPVRVVVRQEAEEQEFRIEDVSWNSSASSTSSR